MHCLENVFIKTTAVVLPLVGILIYCCQNEDRNSFPDSFNPFGNHYNIKYFS